METSWVMVSDEKESASKEQERTASEEQERTARRMARTRCGRFRCEQKLTDLEAITACSEGCGTLYCSAKCRDDDLEVHFSANKKICKMKSLAFGAENDKIAQGETFNPDPAPFRVLVVTSDDPATNDDLAVQTVFMYSNGLHALGFPEILVLDVPVMLIDKVFQAIMFVGEEFISGSPVLHGHLVTYRDRKFVALEMVGAELALHMSTHTCQCDDGCRLILLQPAVIGESDDDWASLEIYDALKEQVGDLDPYAQERARYLASLDKSSG